MSCIRKVEELSTDPNFVGYYDLEEAHRQDISSSYDTGLEEGMEKRNIEIAKNMLKEKIEISLISKMTGLSVDTIKELDLK